jgi:hypothetical protein
MASLRIGELLIQEGLITPAQLQAALTAQQIFGGRLGTNLVEHGFVNEVDLARLLAKQLGIRMVEPHELAELDPKVAKLIPPEVATKYSIVPFRHDAVKDRLAIAIADPTNLQKVDEIQFVLGKRIDLFICPEIMLAFALEKYYGVERTRRYVRLAGVADAEMQITQGLRVAPAASRSSAVGRKMSTDVMLQRVVDARSKADLVESVCDILASLAGQVVFFAVRGEELMGWSARAVPVTPEALRALSLPIRSSPLTGEVLQSCTQRIVPAPGDAALRGVLENALFVDCSRQVFLVPLIVNHKAFGLFVLAQLDDATTALDAPLVAELMKRVAFRFQVFYLMDQLQAPL